MFYDVYTCVKLYELNHDYTSSCHNRTDSRGVLFTYASTTSTGNQHSGVQDLEILLKIDIFSLSKVAMISAIKGRNKKSEIEEKTEKVLHLSIVGTPTVHISEKNDQQIHIFLTLHVSDWLAFIFP